METFPAEHRLAETTSLLHKYGDILQRRYGVAYRICQTGTHSISMILRGSPAIFLTDSGKELLLDLLDASEDIAIRSEHGDILLFLDFDPRFMDL